MVDSTMGDGRRLDSVAHRYGGRGSQRGTSVAWLLVICAMALFCPAGAQAGQISVTSGQSGAPLITIRGELDLNDAVEFMRKTSAVKDAVVVLRSPGGNLLAGLQIGRTVRQRGYLTVIPASTSCSSACALAWLGGTPRFMAQNSRIGFHAAYFMKGGRARTSRAANGVIEDYLRDLGLSERAIDYVTHSPPERLNWLTVAAARELGIEAGIYERGMVMSTLANMPTGPLGEIKRLASLDLLGYDLPGMPIVDTTVTDCEMRCERSTDCGAFTFNTESAACFLKSRTDLAVGNPAAISGYREHKDSHIRRIDMAIQQATDLPGNDIGQQTDTTFEACLVSCSETIACKAFTYVIHRNECWLKDGVGSAASRAGLVSGIK